MVANVIQNVYTCTIITCSYNNYINTPGCFFSSNECDSITKNLADKLYTALSHTDHLTTPLKDTFNTSSSAPRTG